MYFIKLVCVAIALIFSREVPEIHIDPTQWTASCIAGTDYFRDVHIKHRNNTDYQHQFFECIDYDTLDSGFDFGCALDVSCFEASDRMKKNVKKLPFDC
jgi:hypothetical protein